MATIHRTTMVPSKAELLAPWLPQQPWFRQSGQPPRIERVGGFRLDDPAGEVGIDCMLLVDLSSETEIVYNVPLTYRGQPLPGGESALVGTSQHGVLGLRWIYDAEQDPVAVAALTALLLGEAEAQHQDRSETPDPTVVVGWSGPAKVGKVTVERLPSLAESVAGTERGGPLGWIEAGWRLPTGAEGRGPVATMR